MKLYSDEELAEILDQNIFHQISEAADRLGLECYVVGGYVRDISWSALQMISMSSWWAVASLWLRN